LPFPTGLPPASPIYIAGGSPGSTLEYDTSAGLFDPTWFEDMETARFLESKVQSGILHLNAGNDSAQILSMNAVLEANVSTSSFNEALPPELSSTPNASLGFKLRDDALTSSNPLNVAGKRKLTQVYGGGAWLTGGA